MSSLIKNILILFVLLSAIYSCDQRPENKTKHKGSEWFVTKDGDSVLKKYDKDGSLISFTTYKNKIKNGTAKRFYKNGKTQFEINYKNGEKDGVVKWYYENGNLYRVSTYVDGKLEGIQKKYYENGKPMAEIPYKNGKVIPGLKEYTKGGKLKKNYPKLIIKPVDRLAFDNKYILQLSLSPKAKKPKYYQVLKYQGDSYEYMKKLPVKNGKAELVYTVYKGGFVMEKVTFRAELKTSLGNTYVVEKKYNVAIDN